LIEATFMSPATFFQRVRQAQLMRASTHGLVCCLATRWPGGARFQKDHNRPYPSSQLRLVAILRRMRSRRGLWAQRGLSHSFRPSSPPVPSDKLIPKPPSNENFAILRDKYRRLGSCSGHPPTANHAGRRSPSPKPPPPSHRAGFVVEEDFAATIDRPDRRTTTRSRPTCAPNLATISLLPPAPVPCAPHERCHCSIDWAPIVRRRGRAHGDRRARGPHPLVPESSQRVLGQSAQGQTPPAAGSRAPLSRSSSTKCPCIFTAPRAGTALNAPTAFPPSALIGDLAWVQKSSLAVV